MGQALVAELDLAELGERLAVAQGAVADQQDVLAGGHEVDRQVVGRRDVVVGQALDAARAPAGRRR